MTPRPLLLLAVCLACGCACAAAAYTSLSWWQWQRWEQARRISLEGTRDADDLTRYTTDRLLSFSTGAAGGAPQLAQPELPPITARFEVLHVGALAIAAPRSHALPWLVSIGEWLGAAIVAIAAGTAIGLWLARFQLGRKFSARLWKDERRGPLATAAAASAAHAIVWMFPAASAAVWYIGFDRDAERRWVGDALLPSSWEWPGIVVLCALGIAARVAGRWRSFVLRAAGDTEKRELRLCPSCAYPLAGLAGSACPECGGPFTRPVRNRPRRRLALGATLAVVALLVGALALSRSHAVSWRITAAIHWLSLRSQFIPLRSQGFVEPGAVVQMDWPDGAGCFVAAPVVRTTSQGIPEASLGVVWAWRPRAAPAVPILRTLNPNEWLAAPSAKWPRFEFGTHAVVSDFAVFTNQRPLMRFEVDTPPDRYLLAQRAQDSELADAVLDRWRKLLSDGNWALARY